MNMQSNKSRKAKTFPEVLELLSRENERFLLVDLSVFSNISAENLAMLRESWPELSIARKIYLFEGLYLHANESFVADYSQMGYFGVEDADPKVRNYALRLLYDCRTSAFISLILKLASEDPDFEVRQSAIEILGQLMIDREMEDLPLEDGRKALRLLESLKDDLDCRIRWSVMEALAFANHAAVPEMVKSALASEDEKGIIAALRAIQHTLHKSWSDTVLDYLDYPIPSIQAEAIRAAGLIPIRKARKAILTLLTEFDALDNDVFVASILAISQIGGPQTAEILDELAGIYDDDEEMRDLFDEAKDNLETVEFAKKHFSKEELKDFFDWDEEADQLMSETEEMTDEDETDYLAMIYDRISSLPEITEEEEEEELRVHIHHSHSHEHAHDEDEEEDDDDDEEADEMLDWSRFRIIEDLSAEGDFLDEDEDADWTETDSI